MEVSFLLLYTYAVLKLIKNIRYIFDNQMYSVYLWWIY